MATIRVRAGPDAAAITAVVPECLPSILQQRGRPGLTARPWRVPSASLRARASRNGSAAVRNSVGFWRSVGPHQRVRSGIDDDMLAIAAGRDPLFPRRTRLRQALPGPPRRRRRSPSWRKPGGKTTWGVAVAESPAQCWCEVTGSGIHCVVPSSTASPPWWITGTVINPDLVEAQIQGAIIHGLTAALWGEMVRERRRQPGEFQSLPDDAVE